MKGPICQVGLAMNERQGREIDCCPQCCGVWLYGRELFKIIERNMTKQEPLAGGH